MSDIEAQKTIEQRAAELAANMGMIDTELSFLPSLRLAQPMSGVVSDNICKPGDFFYGQDVVLGAVTPGLVYDYQWHAIRLEKKKKSIESYTVEYGEVDGARKIVGDEAFLSIMNGKDNPERGIINLWGPEILVFLPDINKFAILFLNKKTNRRYWNEFLNPAWYNPTEPRLCRFYTTKVSPEGSNYTWWEPHCTIENDVPEGFALPSRSRVDAARKKFQEKASEEESPEEGETPPDR